MNKWILVVDVAKCNNCQNCTMAMKDEYVGNDFPGYSRSQPKQGHEWITIDRHVRGNGSMVDVTYIPRTCNHCENAPCIEAGKGAVTKREDGIVIIDPIKAIGRRDLVPACPYGAIWWNEELQLPQHWTFDAHLLDGGWKEPRCVQACPSEALKSAQLSDDEVQAMVKDQNLTVMKPELKTKPRVYYKGLEVTSKYFLGGNVTALDNDGILENVEGALVKLTFTDAKQDRHMTSDSFGDFKFDGLQLDGAEFCLTISHPKFGNAVLNGTIQQSNYVGSVALR